MTSEAEVENNKKKVLKVLNKYIYNKQHNYKTTEHSNLLSPNASPALNIHTADP